MEEKYIPEFPNLWGGLQLKDQTTGKNWFDFVVAKQGGR